MLCRAPRVMTIMNGKPSQVLVTRLAPKAVAKEPNQLISTGPEAPTATPSSALMAPYWAWNIPFQISAVM